MSTYLVSDSEWSHGDGVHTGGRGSNEHKQIHHSLDSDEALQHQQNINEINALGVGTRTGKHLGTRHNLLRAGAAQHIIHQLTFRLFSHFWIGLDWIKNIGLDWIKNAYVNGNFD